jgi:hypothetical protein
VSDPLRTERLRKTADDPFAFGRVYFPHLFEQPSPAFHKDIIGILLRRNPEEWTHRDEDGTTRQKAGAVIAAPRGHAKSSIVSFTFVIWSLLTQRRKYVLLISATATLVETHIKNIRTELETNDKLLADWGVVRGDLFEDHGRARGKWTDGELEVGFLEHGVIVDTAKVTGRSSGSKLRGLRYGARRPDLCIVDDLEEDEQVETPDQRDKLWRWFHGAVVPMLDPKRGLLFIVGTILHFASLLNRKLTEQADIYVTRRYAALDDDGNPLWPERFSLESLTTIKRTIGSLAFSCEYLNNPHDETSQTFRPGWFRWYTRDQLAYEARSRRWYFRADGQELPLTLFAGVDWAIGEEDQHDRFALVMIGATPDKRYLVMDVAAAHLDVAAQVNRVVQQKQAFPRVARYGIEGNGFQNVLIRQVLQRAQLPVKEIKHQSRQRKRKRIESLAPAVENGRLYLRCCTEDEVDRDPLTRTPTSKFRRDDLQQVVVHPAHWLLYRELVDHPRAERDDAADAAQMAIAVASTGTRAFERVLLAA